MRRSVNNFGILHSMPKAKTVLLELKKPGVQAHELMNIKQMLA
ncbi:MAG: hypothetical protein WAK17_01540 [Candidatus Nitrosopolaris sp.]